MNVTAKIKTAKIEITSYNFEMSQEETGIIETHNVTKRNIEKLVKEQTHGQPCKYNVTITKETYTADIDEFLAIAHKKED